MPRHPVVLVHGYSDQGSSFEPWAERLLAMGGYEREDIHICEYKSLANEVTIKDVAEGFDRALRANRTFMERRDRAGGFDAIVHSTGMLVVRSWLATYKAAENARARSLKRLVALAPASNGSPLAHKGRGFLGAVFKGNRVAGPDFLEAGDMILDGLELGSRFTWDLTHADLLSDTPVYRVGPESPYVFVLCGTEAYGGLRALVNEPGTDGTVRWAGCGLDTQKICIDLARDPATPKGARERFQARSTATRGALPVPFHPVAGCNHATIMSDPPEALVGLVGKALAVSDDVGFQGWLREADAATREERGRIKMWQQFVVRAVDERDDPIGDYYVELFTGEGVLRRRFAFDLAVHAYSRDTSLRCFHVCLSDLLAEYPDRSVPDLRVRLIASSGSRLVGYHGVSSERVSEDLARMNEHGVWDAEIALPETFGEHGVTLFSPFTTTFVELRLNRDPMPFGMTRNELCYFR